MTLIWRKSSVLDGIKLQRGTGIFYDLYIQQKKNISFPEEINVHLDSEDYQKMNDAERDLFMRLISFFMPTELLVQNILGEAFYPYIVTPRAKMAMTVQMFMEDIHSDFFEMILNSFEMDHEELYRIIETDPIIKHKHEMIAANADSISIMNGGVDPASLEGKRKILLAILLNNIVLEGTWFYGWFAMFFSMRETWKMRNVCNGMDLVFIDESFHLQLWVELIMEMINETPWLLDDDQFVKKVHDTVVIATDLELESIKGIYKDLSIFHVSFNEMADYLKFIADRRLQELGFEPHYGVDKNPLRFLEKQDLMTLQNFFEVTPNQYTNF